MRGPAMAAPISKRAARSQSGAEGLAGAGVAGSSAEAATPEEKASEKWSRRMRNC